MVQKISCADPCKLCYATRFRVVFKHIGQLSWITAILTCFPLVSSIIFKEYHLFLSYLTIPIFFLALGAASTKMKSPMRLQANEIFSIISIAFLLTSLMMAFPMMQNSPSWIDAWFEAVSGITTTGLSVVVVPPEAKTFLFTRALLQWYGGIGIVVFSLGLAMQPKMVAKSLGKEASRQEDLISSVRIFARHMLFIYLVLTISCLMLLLFFSPTFFDALVHALTSVSTGGFSSGQESLANFSTPFQSIVSFFTFLGAISMPLFWLHKAKNFRNLLTNIQLIALIAAILIGFILLYGLSDISMKEAFMTAISAQSTAGFSILSMETLPPAAKLILSASMAIGGSIQSSAGGFKILRLLILFKAIQLIFLKTSLSKHAITFPQIGGNKLSDEEKNSCFSIILLFLFTVFLSWFAFLIYGYDPLNSLFEVFSATGTVGLTTGITRSELPNVLKCILCMDMFLGRLEFITFLTLFLPKTFIGKRRSI